MPNDDPLGRQLMDSTAADTLAKPLARHLATEQDKELGELTLELTDDCDSCGYSSDGARIAQALVAVRMRKGNELRFCGHHYARYEASLAGVASKILDKRELANSPAYSGSVHA